MAQNDSLVDVVCAEQLQQFPKLATVLLQEGMSSHLPGWEDEVTNTRSSNNPTVGPPADTMHN